MTYTFSLERTVCVRLVSSVGVIGGCLFLAGICVGLGLGNVKPSETASLQAVATASTVSAETPGRSSVVKQSNGNEHEHGETRKVEAIRKARSSLRSSSPPAAPVRMARDPSSKGRRSGQRSAIGVGLCQRNEQGTEEWREPPSCVLPQTAARRTSDHQRSGLSSSYAAGIASLVGDPMPFQVPMHAGMKGANGNAQGAIDDVPHPLQLEKQKVVVKRMHPLAVPSSLPSSPEASPRGPYFLQVGTFLNRSEAGAWKAELRGKGYTAFVVTRRDLKKRAWYHVGVGDFLDRQAAAQAAHRFKEQERLPALIRRKAAYVFHAL